MVEPASKYAQKRPWSIFGGAIAGWALDSFDLSMMFLLIPTLAGVFFPAATNLAIVSTFSIYFISLVFRPLGGLLFGRVGDRVGRKTAMIITLIGLGIVMFATGLLPSYAQVGVLAPVLLVLLRIFTGTFAGGEYGNSSAIAMEAFPEGRRGRVGGLLQGGYPIGFTLAAVSFLVLRTYYGATGFQDFGWRVMFFVGIIPVAAGLLLRLRMPESWLWQSVASERRIEKAPVRALFRNRAYRRAWAEGALSMTGIAWLYSLTLGFYPTIFPTKAVDVNVSFPSFDYIVIAAILTSFLGYYASGWLSDRVGRRRAIIAFSALGIVTGFPLTDLVFGDVYGIWATGLVASLLAFVTTGVYGVMPSYLSEKFPTAVRGTGVGFSFNSGFIVGSWSSVVVLLLAPLGSASLWLATAGLIALGELLVLVSAVVSKETYHADLTHMDTPRPREVAGSGLHGGGS